MHDVPAAAPVTNIYTAPAPSVPAFTPSVVTGYNGKEMPVQPPHPEL